MESTKLVQPKVWYDYRNQAWVENGVYAKCGHQCPSRDCFACKHSGELPDAEALAELAVILEEMSR